MDRSGTVNGWADKSAESLWQTGDDKSFPTRQTLSSFIENILPYWQMVSLSIYFDSHRRPPEFTV